MIESSMSCSWVVRNSRMSPCARPLARLRRSHRHPPSVQMIPTGSVKEVATWRVEGGGFDQTLNVKGGSPSPLCSISELPRTLSYLCRVRLSSSRHPCATISTRGLFCSGSVERGKISLTSALVALDTSAPSDGCIILVTYLASQSTAAYHEPGSVSPCSVTTLKGRTRNICEGNFFTPSTPPSGLPI